MQRAYKMSLLLIQCASTWPRGETIVTGSSWRSGIVKGETRHGSTTRTHQIGRFSSHRWCLALQAPHPVRLRM
ncbi:uncharacterized protein LY79DRAFT_332498 [Colletotrichum navitas]|uniref:Uncharacterized protein n=1 Tax=Colletotrichum navitas TaxID=681940 RepID=A0AAD8PSE9_9PEZI|nr:uncharacterized protein LY79DRAFT_332498 [Colletotrichum navitas]KAK1579888.1 hypothetical protein LY79DRAFT_332498 [Colletotrichum navitas]